MMGEKTNRDLLFVGIDVAFAKGKRLPVAVCVYQGGSLSPILKSSFPPPPKGKGNVAALDADNLSEFAHQTLTWLKCVEEILATKINRISIDAPKAFCKSGDRRREAERAMDRLGVSCFATPNEAAFEVIRQKARKHIAARLSEASLPHANQIWMLVGFELFHVLGKQWECIEVYPQAIAQTLSAATDHKSSARGLDAQVNAVSKALNMDAIHLRRLLPDISFGSLHDKLDALMSAWVASLDENQRTPLGSPPDDVIWVPNIEKLAVATTMQDLQHVVAKRGKAERPRPTVKIAGNRKDKGTTKPGYVNRNNQQVVRATGIPGTDHMQYIYELLCRNCGHVYGANGSDIWLRRCPQCQGGRPGLETNL